MALSSWKTSQQKTLTVYLLIRFHFSTLRLTTRKGKFSALTPSDLFMSLSSSVFSDIGSLYALVLFFVLTNHAGCYLRAESTAVGTSNYQGKKKWLFLWWEQDSLAGRKKKINPVCTVCWQFRVVGLCPFFWKHLQLPHLKPTAAASRTSWYFVLPVIVLARGINGENWTWIPPLDICFLLLCSLNQNTTRSWSQELLCKCIKVGFINSKFMLEEIFPRKKSVIY